MDSTPEPKNKRPDASALSPLEQLFGSDEAATASKRVRSAVGHQLFEYVLEQPSGGQKPASGRLLIVDHDRLGRVHLDDQVSTVS